jgi:hypothetical protein
MCSCSGSSDQDRVTWDGLPAPLRRAIETRTGRITAVRIADAGQNSPLAAIITARGGRFFAKGMPSGHRRVSSQAREAAVAPLVREISPALLWHLDEAGWNVLGYEYADGRHADYAPGSPDLDRLAHLMSVLGEIRVMAPGPFKRAEDRWRPYLDDPQSAPAFSGPVLTHSDWAPDNVLVSADRAWLIDWAWPTLGAGWIDPACWVLRLMAAGGHTAPEAERQASRLPAFSAADPAHVDLFAAANVRVWAEIAQSSPTAWTARMAQAARSWRAYREGCSLPGRRAPDPSGAQASSAATASDTARWNVGYA